MVSAKALLFRLTSLLVVVDLVRGQFSLRNVSVDDTDPSIDYQPPGAWHLTAMTPLDYPFDATSSHSLADSSTGSTATATFIFTGVAVYFWSPLWPYLVNSLISLDGEPGSCVYLRDYTHDSSVNGVETIASVPVWSRVGLSNTQHTVVVSHCSGGPFVVVDAFTYTVQDIITTSSPSNTPTSTVTAATTVSSTTTATPSSTSSRRIIAIAVGGSIGGLAILAGLITIFVIVTRSRRALKANIKSHLDLNPNSAIGSSPTPLLMANSTSLYPGVQSDYLSEQYNPNAPYNRWTPTSPGSFYPGPNTLPPISEGSPLSVGSQRPDLPEL